MKVSDNVIYELNGVKFDALGTIEQILGLSQPPLDLIVFPPNVKLPPIVTSFGKPIVIVWFVATTSTSLSVPAIVKACEVKLIEPVVILPLYEPLVFHEPVYSKTISKICVKVFPTDANTWLEVGCRLYAGLNLNSIVFDKILSLYFFWTNKSNIKIILRR